MSIRDILDGVDSFFRPYRFSETGEGGGGVYETHLGKSDDSEADYPDVIPVLELRNNVLFPYAAVPVYVSRPRSVSMVESLSDGSYVGVFAQKELDVEEPKVEDIYPVGVLARVGKRIRTKDSRIQLILEGRVRIQLEEVVSSEPYYQIRYRCIPERSIADELPLGRSQLDEMLNRVSGMWMEYERMNHQVPSFTSYDFVSAPAMVNMAFVNMMCVAGGFPVNAKQQLLEDGDYGNRLDHLRKLLDGSMVLRRVQQKISDRMRDQMETQQREVILRQHLDAIQKELGEDDSENDDIEELVRKASRIKWSSETREVFDRELQRLSRMNSMAPDYSIQLSYLELMVDLPWNKFSKDNYDLDRARRILDEDHFGIEQVKERILEYLAVLKLKQDLKAPILCLCGPPGVGKTSLGRSVARALNRKYARISLGGVDDEAEIRGHRRTYIGAMPGRILQNLRKVKTSNPVIILDEIDKLGSSRMGDPASALLEVLDPEQNTTFSDNYLETEFDLSHILFITTANDTSTIHPALLDRMELIELTGYLMEEKVQIAQRFLIPKQVKAHGLRKTQFKMSDELLESVISHYTRESGVRRLDQTLAKLIRQQAKRIASEEKYNRTLTAEDVRTRLGMERYLEDRYTGSTPVGVSIGMAWTSVGGDILYVESSLSEGKGKLTLTGNLGDVMKESAHIALQVVRSHAQAWKLDASSFGQTDVHIHVPEGAIPKDGPSAGVTMLTSLVSSFGQRVPRPGVAMTGEITLSGRVLPVGGIKEKILAAKRCNIFKIILPVENQRDIAEINAQYIEGLEFTYVGSVDELMGVAFE